MTRFQKFQASKALKILKLGSSFYFIIWIIAYYLNKPPKLIESELTPKLVRITEIFGY